MTADENRVFERRGVPPVAWMLSGAAGVSVTILSLFLLAGQGHDAFFSAGDSRYFLLTARDLFGTGHGFAGVRDVVDVTTQVPYRYGRVGLPITAWVLTLGRPALVGWGMIAVNLAALTAIPGLVAVYLSDHRAPPIAAVFVFVLPGFLLLYGTVVSDPLVIALILTAYILDGRSYRRSAIATLAFAILVKEVAVLALVPLAWRALRRHDLRRVAVIASAVLPYAAWCLWVRLRIGAFPFLADTAPRRGALGPPFGGIRYTLDHWPYEGAAIFGLLIVTIAVGASGAWVARRHQIGLLAALFTLLTLCLGPEGLRYVGETVRVFLLPQLFGGLALAVGLLGRERRRAAPVPPAYELSVTSPDL
jgi:hypothetical protein